MSPPRPFLTAAWHHLVMLNYDVDSTVLAPYVPRGTELDRWSGRCYVSLVGFRFLHTRVLGLPIPFHTDFDEINLRFYVRRETADGWRRGVVFIGEVVPRRAIASVARAVYNENYVACPTRSVIEEPEGGTGRCRYEWKPKGMAPFAMEATIRGPAGPVAADSEAAFISEHYWGYTVQRDGGTVEYQVEHPPWDAWTAEAWSLTGPVATFYGDAFGAVCSAPPTSAFVAYGLAVTVYRGQRIA